MLVRSLAILLAVMVGGGAIADEPKRVEHEFERQLAGRNDAVFDHRGAPRSGLHILARLFHARMALAKLEVFVLGYGSYGALLIALAIFGAALKLRDARSWPLAAAALCYIAPFVLIIAYYGRYRAPIEPVVGVLADEQGVVAWVLDGLGGREIAAMFGAALAARQHGIPLLLDGFVCTAAASPLPAARRRTAR